MYSKIGQAPLFFAYIGPIQRTANLAATLAIAVGYPQGLSSTGRALRTKRHWRPLVWGQSNGQKAYVSLDDAILTGSDHKILSKMTGEFLGDVGNGIFFLFRVFPI
jgi:hypothetical protein